MKGGDLLSALRRFFSEQNQTDTISDSALANAIGQTQANVAQWKTRAGDITPRQIVNLLRSYGETVEAKLAKSSISPVVEFFEIDRCESKRGAKYEIFSTKDDKDVVNSYRSGIREILSRTKGLYIFYDSRGRALYAGRTTKQFLWNEINSAYNRNRGKDLQSIKIVSHPESKKKYERYDEKIRQITTRGISLHEVAAYFSAYEVHELLITNLESLIIRSFANDLLNKKMEHFGSNSK